MNHCPHRLLTLQAAALATKLQCWLQVYFHLLEKQSIGRRERQGVGEQWGEGDREGEKRKEETKKPRKIERK